MAEAENTANITDQSLSGTIRAAYPTTVPRAEHLMDGQLLNACSKGDANLFQSLIDENPDRLLSVTPQGNNCLHLAAMLGHHLLVSVILSRAPFLLYGTNKDKETPLIVALMAAQRRVARMFYNASNDLQTDIEGRQLYNEMLLQIDKRGDSALHHAIRNGLDDFAVKLLDQEKGLSKKVNNYGESPMHMAARKGYNEVLESLLQISDSAHSGPEGSSALHAAAKAGHTGIIKKLLEERPRLAYYRSDDERTPLALAVINNNPESVQILLEYDHNLAYKKDGSTDCTPFLLAARKGFVPIAEVIISFCFESAYTTTKKANSANALHLAILHDRRDFVDFILETPELHRLINQVDDNGDLPLHYAARSCNPQVLRSLLSHRRQDNTALNAKNFNAVDIICDKDVILKTLKWDESFKLLSDAIPSAWWHAVGDQANEEIKKAEIKETKELSERYATNTSLVAALLATITFAAAFTLPGGFSSDPSNAGQPIFARKVAFQVFLISDTIAMCSSLVVAFLCVLTPWRDLDFLLNYKKATIPLMWCAFTATAVAFGTGLFTVMAPKRLWLAIFIMALSCILPFFSKIIGDWPKIMLRYRLWRYSWAKLLKNVHVLWLLVRLTFKMYFGI
ncbi:hypothetical protein LUZ63_016583 [Rhynchospora breviuscula]|uniref:PGG domain-containing protein n=1 Tax=Rhynchospora breviuscula TaxID=2022672 RepID=A0A9P9ZA80_9POAL|nr:hypothetical protein LUZ63_016583 [Rhynchospora breviuscula]